MIDKNIFRKTEAALYRYFKYKNKIVELRDKIKYQKKRLVKIESDIRSANITIDYYQNGIGISEKVQTSSSGISFVEEQMCKEIGKLEREHLIISKNILKNEHKVRDLEEYIDNMETNLNTLCEEDRKYIELFYGNEKNILAISKALNISKSTAYRKRSEVIEEVAKFKNTLMFKKAGKVGKSWDKVEKK
ncbi:transcriptional regulator [Clostridium baratii]|uniref:transcriptional regulator n=1 Tax=Clostridium baratii TaxID=1561 RepID=UPI0030D5210B